MQTILAKNIYAILSYTRVDKSKYKFKFTVVYKIRITAGLTSIREVAALYSPTRIAYQLNKGTFLSNNAVL